MATYTESFTSTLGGALQTAGTDLTWTDVDAGWSVLASTNRAQCEGVSYSRAEHDTATSDQYAQLVVTQLTNDTGEQAGPCVRFQAAANSSYMFMIEATSDSTWQARLRKTISGARTDLSANVAVASLPVTIRVEVQGSTLRGYVNGVEQVSATDPDLATGTRGGIYGSRSTTFDMTEIDDFEFGDLAAAGSTVDLTPATFTLAGAALDPVPGPAEVTLTPAALTLAAQPVDSVPGPVAVDLTPAALTLSAVVLDPVPGAVTVDLVPAVMTLAAVPLASSMVGGEVTLTPAVMAFTAVPLDPVPEPVTVQLTPAVMALAAVPLTIQAAIVRSPNTGTVTRPDAGTVLRPVSGTVTRPDTGVTARPTTGTVTRP